MEGLGYSSLVGSLVIAFIYIFQIPTRFLVSTFEKLLGQIPVVLLGISGYALYAFVFACGTTLWHFMVATIILGVTSALFWTSGLVLLLNNTDKERYGRSAGALYAGVGLGTAIGVLWLNKVLAQFGGKTMFLLAGVPPLLALLLVLKLSLKNIVVSRKIDLKSLKEIAGKEAFIVGVLLFISSFSYGIVYGGFSILISREIGLAWIGALSVSFYLLKSIFSKIGGGVSDFLGRRAGFIISFVLGALASFMLGRASTPAIFIIAGALLGFQVSTVSVNANAWIADVAGLDDRSTYMAFIFAFGALGTTVSLLLSGYFLATPERTILAFVSFALLNIVAAILSIFTERKEHSKEG